MKIIVAPDSFKECMSARTAALSMNEAIKNINPNIDVVLLPVADGGEGTLEVLTYTTKGTIYEKDVTGPLGEIVTAKYAILGDGKTGVVEMAEASGLHLVAPDKRNPLKTTTYGTGELIKTVLDAGVSEVIVTIGGSATNDAGVGMLQALGATITNQMGKAVGFGGGALGNVKHVDFHQLDPRLATVKLSIACDVTNTLVGPKGASEVFGPQKGASSEMVAQLDENLTRFADLLTDKTGMNVANTPGSGAAGGLGAALLICGGTITPGIDLVLDVVQFNEKLQGVDYIFTGEGKIDSQTPDGKVIAGISKRGKQNNIPVIAFAGTVKPGYESLLKGGLNSVHSITQGPCTLEEALKSGKENLIQTVENITRLML